MKENSKSLLQEIDQIFSAEPSINQKAWGIIHDFYHFILLRMEKDGVSKSDLAKRLGRSRSAISQMFNKNPNITIKKMVEIAESVGLDLTIIPTDLKKEMSKKPAEKIYTFVLVTPGSYRQERITYNDTLPIPNGVEYITSRCSNVSTYKTKEYLN